MSIPNVYVWNPAPDRQWYAREMATGISQPGESRAEVLAVFDTIWAGRSDYRIVDGAPPRRRRPDEPQEPIPEDDNGKRLPGYSVYRKLLKRFHPDTNAGKEFTANDVTAALVSLWTAARGAK